MSKALMEKSIADQMSKEIGPVTVGLGKLVTSLRYC